MLTRRGVIVIAVPAVVGALLVGRSLPSDTDLAYPHVAVADTSFNGVAAEAECDREADTQSISTDVCEGLGQATSYASWNAWNRRTGWTQVTRSPAGDSGPACWMWLADVLVTVCPDGGVSVEGND